MLETAPTRPSPRDILKRLGRRPSGLGTHATETLMELQLTVDDPSLGSNVVFSGRFAMPTCRPVVCRSAGWDADHGSRPVLLLSEPLRALGPTTSGRPIGMVRRSGAPRSQGWVVAVPRTLHWSRIVDVGLISPLFREEVETFLRSVEHRGRGTYEWDALAETLIALRAGDSAA